MSAVRSRARPPGGTSSSSSTAATTATRTRFSCAPVRASRRSACRTRRAFPTRSRRSPSSRRSTISRRSKRCSARTRWRRSSSSRSSATAGSLRPTRRFFPGSVCWPTHTVRCSIFDEVMTGFRVAFGGARERFGVTADLTTLGKVIGGGLPVAAYGGRRDLMEQVAPSGTVYQAGTLSGNPLAMAAGIATLDALTEDLHDEIVRHTGAARAGMREIAARRGVPFTADSAGSMWGFFFRAEPVRSFADAKTSGRRAIQAILPRGAGARRVSRAVGVRGGVHVVGAHGRRHRRNARPPRRRDGGGGMSGWTALAAAALLAIASPSRRVGKADPPAQRSETLIRVLLSARATTARVSSPSGFNVLSAGGSLMARGRARAAWRIEHEGRRVRAVRPDGVPTVWVDGPMSRAAGGVALLSHRRKTVSRRHRVLGVDSGRRRRQCAVDRRLSARRRAARDRRPSSGRSAAVQAQAVTARSYAYIHLSTTVAVVRRDGGVLDQVYGGVAAETPSRRRRWSRPAALVLKYAGRVVNAPYRSTCGGSTAAASEVWRSSDEPYLQRVSDRIPGTSRYYCDMRAALSLDAHDRRGRRSMRRSRGISRPTRTVPGNEPGSRARP